MEEQREESEFSGDCRESVEKAGKGSKTETLGGEVDVPHQDPSIKDAKTVENSDSGVCDASGTDGGLATEDCNTGNSVSDEEQAKVDAGNVEKMVGSVSGVVEAKNNVEKTISSDDEPETEKSNVDCEGDAGAVKSADETVKVLEVEKKDEKAMPEIERKNGASHEEECLTSAVTDEKAKCEVEDNSGASDAEQNVEGDMVSAAVNKADQEKESTKQTEEDSNKLGVDSEPEKEEKMDVDSKHADKENVGLNKQGNHGSETTDAKPSESAQVPEETNEGNSGAVSDGEEEITNGNQKEENGEAMEIDNVAEEQVEKDVIVDGVLSNAGNESAGATMIETQDVPVAEADRNDSNVKEMEIDERNDNVDVATDLTGKIESADSANPNSPTEDAAATGEVEPLDHNALFDPTSDITNFIDFTGVSSWSGNIQELKTETGDASLKEDKKAHDMAEEVAREDSKDTLKSVDSTANAESSEACQEDKDHESLDKKTVDQQEDDNAHEAPSMNPNQKEDTEMEENPNTSDYGTDSDRKTNGVKRKADVLSEDSPREGRKTVSFAKVSFSERTSFKIGASIARAASQMAGSPSVLKGSNFGDETLNVENFVSQLHCAATDPVKENVVSEIATEFFLDFRNSSASQQVTQEKVSRKRARPSDSSAGGTEAFEFEEMGDTYWTDRVIHNGGEEQTPPTEKGSYQVVPVELKPAQVRTRRPYRRRQSQINIPPPQSASEKPPNFDENAPTELIMKFSEADTIPSEKSLSKMFRHFGPIKESQTEVDKENNRARVVYRKGSDAEVAYNSAGRFSIFGTKAVNYELSHTITETFKVKPYVVSLGEEEAAALDHPS